MTTLQLPAFLYGSHKEVVNNCRKISSDAFRHRAWDSVICIKEGISVGNENDIWICDSSRCLSRNAKAWRLYPLRCCMDAYLVQLNSVNESDGLMKSYDAVMLSGMTQYWFMLCLIGLGSGDFYRSSVKGIERPVDIMQQYLISFVRWIPQLCRDDIQFRGPGFCTIPIKNEFYFYLPWHATLDALFHHAGYPIPQGARMRRNRGAYINYLISNRIIECSGDACNIVV